MWTRELGYVEYFNVNIMTRTVSDERYIEMCIEWFSSHYKDEIMQHPYSILSDSLINDVNENFNVIPISPYEEFKEKFEDYIDKVYF